MAQLDPALFKYVWNPRFWWSFYKNRENWQACERCGFLNECLPYGESVLANYRALEAQGLFPPQPKIVHGPEDKRVCHRCCLDMREAFNDMPVV